MLLQPGESRDVTFTLSGKELGYYDTKGNWLVEPGKFQLWIARIPPPANRWILSW